MTEPAPQAASTPPQSPPHHLPRYIVIAGVLGLALWLALGGYTRLTTPNPFWPLPNGDTIEVLTNRAQSDFTDDSGHLGVSRYALLQFRSSLKDSVRDVRDIQALADLVCRSAQAHGYRRLKVEAAANALFAVFGLSRGRWYRIDSAGQCEQYEPL